MAGDRSRSGWFGGSWLPPAAALVLRYEPEHERARAIWRQVLDDTAAAPSRSWLPPGVVL